MTYTEISKLNNHELKQKLSEIQTKLGELQLKKSVSPSAIKDTSVFKKMRVSIAQMYQRLTLNKANQD